MKVILFFIVYLCFLLRQHDFSFFFQSACFPINTRRPISLVDAAEAVGFVGWLPQLDRTCIQMIAVHIAVHLDSPGLKRGLFLSHSLTHLRTRTPKRTLSRTQHKHVSGHKQAHIHFLSQTHTHSLNYITHPQEPPHSLSLICEHNKRTHKFFL